MVGFFDQCVTAVGAFQQTCKEVDTAAFGGAFDVLTEHLLHALKVIFVNDRLMRIAHPNPFLGRAFACRLALVVDLLAFALHHVADVHLVLQGTSDGFVAPQGRITDGPCFEVHPVQLFICRRIRDAVVIEIPHDRADPHAAQIHLEYQFHVFGGRLVDHQLVVIGRAFFVAVFGEGADEVAAPAFHIEGGADVFGVGGDVVFVDHPAHGVVEKVDGGALTFAGVDRVIDGDVAHLQTREHLADITPAFAGVSAEARAVLDDHAVDLARVEVGHHALKVGAVEVCARKAVVHIDLTEFDVRLAFDEVGEQLFLIDDGVGFGLVAVVARQPNIKSSPVGFQNLRRLLICVIIHGIPP